MGGIVAAGSVPVRGLKEKSTDTVNGARTQPTRGFRFSQRRWNWSGPFFTFRPFPPTPFLHEAFAVEIPSVGATLLFRKDRCWTD